jgi:hypothetical protein
MEDIGLAESGPPGCGAIANAHLFREQTPRRATAVLSFNDELTVSTTAGIPTLWQQVKWRHPHNRLPPHRG